MSGIDLHLNLIFFSTWAESSCSVDAMHPLRVGMCGIPCWCSYAKATSWNRLQSLVQRVVRHNECRPIAPFAATFICEKIKRGNIAFLFVVEKPQEYSKHACDNMLFYLV